MKPKPLTQIELATLASNLPTGTAKERVNLALEIWLESDPVRAELAFRYDRLAAYETQWKEIPAILISYAQALEEMFPDSHTVKRDEEFSLFRAWQRGEGIDVPPLESEKKIGVLFKPAMLDEIDAWRLAEKKATAAEKASKAATARWADKTAKTSKAGGKTQQVKKKSKS